MRITFNLQLDSKPDANGFWSVFVRLHAKGEKPGRLMTDVKIQNAPKYWAGLDKKRKEKGLKPEWGKWVTGHVDREALNRKIENEYNRIKALVESWQKEQVAADPDLTESTYTPSQLADKYRARLSDRYFDLTTIVQEEAKTALAYATYELREAAIDRLKDFAGATLEFRAVTTHLAEKFQDWLKNKYVSKRTKKGIAHSSVNAYFEALNTLHVEVLRLKGYSKKKAELLSPFSDVDKLNAKSIYRAKLDEAQIETLTNTEVTTSKRRVIKPAEAFAYWTLSYLLAGMRYSDLLLLRYKNFELDEADQPVQCRYTMMKTGNVVTLPVFEEARTLLQLWWKADHKPDDYVLPGLKATEIYATYTTPEELKAAPFAVRKRLKERLQYLNDRINSALSELTGEAGMNIDLGMHNARHSIADLARRIMQEDGTLTLIDITNMLGQRDPKMVLTYIEDMAKQDITPTMRNVLQRKKKPAEPTT